MARLHPIPGESLVGRWPLLAAALIAANDWVIRAHWPGLLSGKLSDIGICFLLPVTLFAGMEWSAFAVSRLRRRTWRPASWRLAAMACSISAAYFSALKLWPSWVGVHRGLIASLGLAPVQVTADWTDLLCLPVCGLAFVYLKARATPALEPAAQVPGAFASTRRQSRVHRERRPTHPRMTGRFAERIESSHNPQ